ncbi:MAG: hypothetical protein JWO80_4343 [Bryobacterales bacterium]|nr:hypothetical protein [Bryobacterales bacterium]
MRSRDEIERLLFEELDRAKLAHEHAKKEFKAVLSQIPSGLPQPDGTARISNAGRANASTLNGYVQALREFNAFVIHGAVPERLKE